MTARSLVLYDGVCGLCDSAVQWLLRRDRKGVLTFAPLQGETAGPYLAAADEGRGGDGGFDTIVYIERGDDGREQVFVRSSAAFRILRRLGGGYRWLSIFGILPRFITDALYRFVSKRRRRWCGKLAASRVPDAATRMRFLP